MLTLGVLFFAIGFILVLFNTVNFSFVRDQEKNKKQALAGFVVGTLGLILLVWALIRMNGE